MSTFRKLLLSLLLVSLTGSAFGAGTFASFTASTTNAGSTFASGSLVLSNEVAAAGACFSSGDTTDIGDGVTDAAEDDASPNSSTCDALFDGLVAYKPGEFAVVNLTLENDGNTTGTTIVGEGLTCAPGDVSAANGPADTPYKGDGDPCEYLTIQVQEYSTPARAPGDVTRCLYPVAVGACVAAEPLHDFVTDTGATPMTVHNVPATIAPNAPRYLTVRIDFPNGAPGLENEYMGRTATFGILWTLQQ